MNRIVLLVCALAAVAVAIDPKFEDKKASERAQAAAEITLRNSVDAEDYLRKVENHLDMVTKKLNVIEKVADKLAEKKNRLRRAVRPLDKLRVNIDKVAEKDVDAEDRAQSIDSLEQKLSNLEASADRIFGASNSNALAVANANSFGFGGLGILPLLLLG